MDRFHRAWTVWVAVAGGSFLVLETVALARYDKGRNTFCEYYRHHTGIRPVRKYRALSIAALAAFQAWFFVHIVTGRI